MGDSFKDSMDTAKAFCAEHHIEWYELRNVVINAEVARDPQAWEGHGIGSSDGNHMIHSAVLMGELEELCRDLIERGKLIAACANGREPRQVLAELREFFAPVSA